MLDAVLDERLEGKLKDSAAHQLLGNLNLIIEYILKAEFLDIQIIAQMCDFLFQRNFIPVLDADPQNTG
ncbi:hypothetical protein D3C73_602630 [compost metagenome]